ncbi:hypothetical protein [Lutibaculum baratangense]|uniref:Uncharacterized protein n=1 Tax=Lutibaculum baratangense AMV1 TaxID=631454 RepID=V4RQ86_9HYPH|nr:hypothetical protein [Lutibaculum baratangense]ESR27394.1 hypothetical protein N177_0088 [Lutibaculum baratangense AMV1]
MFEVAVKVLAGTLVIVAAAGFLIPPLGTAVHVLTAWRFGATGYVYYGVGKNGEPTQAGKLYLIRTGSRDYDSIGFGDKLQAASLKYFRDGPSASAPAIFILQRGECVTVLAKVWKSVSECSVSGGWLRVATSGCGLFR